MTSFLQKYLPWILLALLIALIVSLIIRPQASAPLSLILLFSSLGMALFFAVQKQAGPYQQGQINGLRFTRNVLLDILGLLLTIAAASYLGGLAGTRLGTSFGIWAGLIAGIASAFLAAWLVRKLWAKVHSG
jgi:hypothetical protein